MPDVTYAYLPDPTLSAFQVPDDFLESHIEELLDTARQVFNEGKHLSYERAFYAMKDGLISWVNVGLYGFAVKSKKLYKEHYQTFKDFCEKALGSSHWRINSYIKAAKVVIDLAQAGFKVLPTCEAQCQPLVKLEGNELIEQWQKIVDDVPAHLITKNKIEEILEVAKPKKASILLDVDIADKLRKKASDMGMSLDELISILLGESEDTESISEDKAVDWEEDLSKLVEDNCSEETPLDLDSQIDTELAKTNIGIIRLIGYCKRIFGVAHPNLLSQEEKGHLLSYLKAYADRE